MSKWYKDRLEQMTKTQNEFIKTKIDYISLAEAYEEIIIRTYTNGDVVPLAFKDVEVAYDGKLEDEIKLPSIDDHTKELIEEKENEQHVIHIKHFSRSISHQAWFDFLDSEVKDFIEKYPEYEKILL